jgi:MtrB/PioB family decaheme-associated outer membrane protein
MRARLPILLASALLAAGAAWAEDTPAPTPTPAPAPAGDSVDVHGGTTIGAGSVSGLNESSKFQEYREIPNGFFLPSLDFGLEKDKWRFDLQAIDLLQEDQRIVATMGKPGSYRLVLGYDQTPHWYSNTAATLFASPGGGREIFPTTIRQQIESAVPASNAGVILQSSLNAAQPFPDLRTRRDRAFGALDWTLPVPGLTLRAGFEQEQRDGTHPQTLATNFSVGPDITEFAGQTNFTTQTARLGLDYVHKIFWVGGEATWSNFRNDMTSAYGGSTYQDAYIVDNPLRATDGTPAIVNPAAPNNPAGAHFLLSSPPDSRSAWFNLNGGVKFGGWGRLSLLYGVGRSKQDEAFLPFTLNTAIVPPTPLVILEGGPAGTAVTRYDGTIDLSRWDARFDARPLRWLAIQVFGNSYDYDNKTPLYDLPNWVSTDVALANVAVEAEPFAYKVTRYGALLTFRPAGELAIDVGGDRESWTRTFRAAPHTDENIGRFNISWEPAVWGRVRFGYREGKRRYDSYTDDPGDPVGLRTFDVANRDQKRYDFLADFTPVDRFSFGVQLHSVDDDYPDSVFGRTHDKSTGWAVDFSLDAGRGVTLSGNYGEDRFDWSMQSQYRANPPDDPLNLWSTSPKDRTKSYGLGLNANLIKDRLTFDVHGTITDSTGEQPATFVPGGAAQSDGTPFPNVTDRLVVVDSSLNWAIKKGLGAALAYTYEAWDAMNFQRDVMQPWMGAVDGGTAESVFLGVRVPNYNANWLRVLLTYRF